MILLRGLLYFIWILNDWRRVRHVSILLLLLIYIIMKSRNQSIMIYQSFPFFFVYALNILATFIELGIAFIHTIILNLFLQWLINNFDITLLLYHRSTSAIKRFQGTFSAWVNVIRISITYSPNSTSETLNKAFPWKSIVKVTLSHERTTVHSNGLATYLTHSIIVIIGCSLSWQNFLTFYSLEVACTTN